MKLKLTLLLYLIVGVGIFAKANKASLFTYDKVKLHTVMKEADKIVNEHLASGKTLTQMKQENNALVRSVHLNKNFALTPNPNEVLGIPSFIWGCFLGPVGFIVVALESKDSKEETQAGIGCAASSIVFGVLALIAGLFSAANNYSGSCY